MRRKLLFLSSFLVFSLACGSFNSLPRFLRQTSTEKVMSQAMGESQGYPTVTKTPADVGELYPTITITPGDNEKNYPTVTTTPKQNAVAEQASQNQFGQRARGYLEDLSVKIGPRVDNTIGAARAVEYIKEQFLKMGYAPKEQPFNYEDEDGNKGRSANVIAVKKGISERQIIVGAHYDSTEDDGSFGADDNASGVAVMMEAAERVQALETPYTIVFIAFGAEEVDILGSDYYVSQMDKEEISNTVVMVNLDCLIAGNKTYIYGTKGKDGKVRDWVLELAKSLSLDLKDQPNFTPNDPNDSSDDFSDNGPFRLAGIQFAYFEAADWDLGDQDGWTQVDPKYGSEGEIWHTRYDNIDYLEKTFPGRINVHLKLFSTILFNILTKYQE